MKPVASFYAQHISVKVDKKHLNLYIATHLVELKGKAIN